MENDVFILLGMIFCHIIVDFYIQGWLSFAKEKEWWVKNAPSSLYKYDFIMVLFMHSFCWAFAVSLIPLLCLKVYNLKYIILFICNIIIHILVDDLKLIKRK